MKTFMIIILLKFTLFYVKTHDTVIEFLTIQTTLEEQFYKHVDEWNSFFESYQKTEKQRIKEITKLETKQENDEKTLKSIIKKCDTLTYMVVGLYGFLFIIALLAKPGNFSKAIRNKLINGKVVLNG